jgi:hypothetical protein
VSNLRPELASVIEQLVAGSGAVSEISLDALGDAIGTLSVSYPEIDLMISALEARGLTVVAPSNPRGEQHLREVLTTARSLSRELGRRPNIAEICERSQLDPEQVKHALMLARVMQR